jgi:hypothetical protein
VLVIVLKIILWIQVNWKDLYFWKKVDLKSNYHEQLKDWSKLILLKKNSISECVFWNKLESMTKWNVWLMIVLRKAICKAVETNLRCS